MSMAYRDAPVGWLVLVAVGLAAGVSVFLFVASADPRYRDNEAVPVPASVGVLPNQYLETRGEVFEPDPGMYDREGLERWWRDYQSRHPNGQ
jgi:hypothetical protein